MPSNSEKVRRMWQAPSSRRRHNKASTAVHKVLHRPEERERDGGAVPAAAAAPGNALPL